MVRRGLDPGWKSGSAHLQPLVVCLHPRNVVQEIFQSELQFAVGLFDVDQLSLLSDPYPLGLDTSHPHLVLILQHMQLIGNIHLQGISLPLQLVHLQIQPIPDLQQPLRIHQLLGSGGNLYPVLRDQFLQKELLLGCGVPTLTFRNIGGDEPLEHLFRANELAEGGCVGHRGCLRNCLLE